MAHLSALLTVAARSNRVKIKRQLPEMLHCCSRKCRLPGKGRLCRVEGLPGTRLDPVGAGQWEEQLINEPVLVEVSQSCHSYYV